MTYNDYDERIINSYSQYSIEELNDKLDEAKARIDRANAVFMKSGLNSDKDAMESASIRFYNLQMVLRHRGAK